MTRGRTVQLLGFAVLAFVILAAIDIVALILGVGGGFAVAGGAIAAARADPQAFFASPQAAFGLLGPALVIWSLLLVITSGAATAIFRAPFAYVYRRLAGEDAAEAFT